MSNTIKGKLSPSFIMGITVGDTVSVTFMDVDTPEQPTMRIESVSRKMSLGYIRNTAPMFCEASGIEALA